MVEKNEEKWCRDVHDEEQIRCALPVFSRFSTHGTESALLSVLDQIWSSLHEGVGEIDQSWQLFDRLHRSWCWWILD